MKNAKDNFWHWDMKIGKTRLSRNSFRLFNGIEELNIETDYMKAYAHTLCGIHDDDLLLFETYLDFIDDVK